MVVVDGGHAEEHEDDGLGGAAQHLHGVLERCLGLGANVALHVVLHGDAAEGDAGRDKGNNNKKSRLKTATWPKSS